MKPFQTQLQAIKAAYPELIITSVNQNEGGQYNDVLVINEALIFRFPKFTAGIEQLALETDILTAVQLHISLCVPNPIYVDLETAVIGEAFMGYQMIPGEPLWFATVHAIQDEPVLNGIATQLAQFLKELHSIPITDILGRELPVSETKAEWLDIYGRVQMKLFPYMRLDACKAVAQQFESQLENPAIFNFQPCLRHGDFGTGNILYDPSAQQINGIIDFGFTILGDPAFDFAGLFNYGEPFLRRLIPTYPEIENYWERIRFYNGTFALLDALFGIENGDQTAFESGLAAYV
ncbi:MAG: aminoglycoside phosphotransferase family protein [Chloroflexi bacterium]|nr:aminoglycoside phosphotransferase family protein [Chloroflexota bacterium]